MISRQSGHYTPGEVEIVFMPWSQWRMSGSSFDELVEDYNL